METHTPVLPRAEIRTSSPELQENYTRGNIISRSFAWEFVDENKTEQHQKRTCKQAKSLGAQGFVSKTSTVFIHTNQDYKHRH